MEEIEIMKYSEIIKTEKGTYKIGVDNIPANLFLIKKQVGVNADGEPIWSGLGCTGLLVFGDEIINMIAAYADEHLIE